MKKLILILFIAFACTPAEEREALETIESHLIDQAEGLQIEYQSEELEIKEDITYGDLANSLADSIQIAKDSLLANILQGEEYFSLEKLKDHRHPDGNDGYFSPIAYDYALSDECNVDWCIELENYLPRLDSLIENYDSLNLREDTELWEVVTWFDHTSYDFHVDGYANPLDDRQQAIDEIQEDEERLEEYRNKDKEEIYAKRVYNEYTAINPMMDMRQNYERDFLISPEGEVIKEMEI